MRSGSGSPENGTNTEYKSPSDVLTMKKAFRIQEKGLEWSKCKRIGDGSFFMARRKWEIIKRDFPVSQETHIRLQLDAL